MDRDPRIEDLIARMTVEEKVGQLGVYADMVRPFAPNVNPDANAWTPAEVLDQVRRGRVGALFNGAGAAVARETQRIAVEESRLGVPLLFAADVIHGMRTVFPIPLGEAASFEPDLAERTARATAIEATAEGVHWTFAPMVDVARDQRWGRVAETSGEDTVLNSAFAAARVRGFQGDDLTAPTSLLATPKHFAAYGAVLAGMEYNSVDLSEAQLRDVHLPPFQAAFAAGAITVMSAFNDINGVPATANRWLLTDLLRGEWGFEGLVVSDYTADRELIAHGYAEDEADAARLALTAGLDMSMQSDVFATGLPGLVESGRVPMAALDEAVRRVLRVKTAVGLFDDPYRCLDPAREADRGWLADHTALAREAARRSIVMLRNDGVLPLAETARIALIGPFASDRDNLEGCWNLFGDRDRAVTLEEGIRAALGQDGALTVVPGCDFEAPLPGGIEAAAAAARAADVVLLAVGEPEVYSGEAQSRTQIVVPAAQQALAEAVAATGTPVVVLLRNGRALALQGAIKDASAVLVTWYLGVETGHAAADVLFGGHGPSGRLPVSFPHDSGQQPYFYNHLRTGRPELEDQVFAFKSRWREYAHSAAWPFGFGLTYGRIDYAAPTLSTERLGWDETLDVSVAVTNVGDRDAEEVVQLYIHDRVASRVRPVRELKRFEKVGVGAGETVEVRFQLTRADLAFTTADGAHAAEPGRFDLWCAPHSRAGQPVTFELLVAED